MVKKCAAWEPVIVLGNSVDTTFVSRYEKEIREGRTDAALVTSMLGTQLGPSLFMFFPRGLLDWLTRNGIRKREK